MSGAAASLAQAERPEIVLLAEADDFDREVEMLRASPTFQKFLDERSRSTRRIALEQVEAEIEQQLQEQKSAI